MKTSYIKIGLGVVICGLVVFGLSRSGDKVDKNALVPPVPPPFNASTEYNSPQVEPARDESLYHTLMISNTTATLSIPKNYTLGKSETWGDGGIQYQRFGFMDADKVGEVQLKNITIWTGESDNLYFETCADEAKCNKGEQVSVLNDYYFEKRALEGRQDFQDFKYHPFGSKAWFVRDTPCLDETCIEREYSIFLKNMRIAIVAVVKNTNQLALADELYAKLHIFLK